MDINSIEGCYLSAHEQGQHAAASEFVRLLKHVFRLAVAGVGAEGELLPHLGKVLDVGRLKDNRVRGGALERCHRINIRFSLPHEPDHAQTLKEH